jgi:ribosome-associated protein
MSRASPTPDDLVAAVVRLAREKRAEDVVVLDVRGLVDYMDFLVVATGRSDRQNRAIAENVVRGLKKMGRLPLSRSGVEAGTWICVDLVDAVLHVFTPEVRAYYDLELLWADAPRMDVSAIRPQAERAREAQPG